MPARKRAEQAPRAHAPDLDRAVAAARENVAARELEAVHAVRVPAERARGGLPCDFIRNSW
jgi:hypothetical protein